MSGETEEQVSGWTVDTLHALMQRSETNMIALLKEKDLRDQQRFEALQRAIDKAETATEKRFESVNEFRAQLADQSRQFLPRQEYDRAHTDLIERVDQMRQTFTDHMALLDKQVGENTARRGGLNDAWGYIVGAIALAGTVVGIVIATR